jgi:hypothetical protein
MRPDVFQHEPLAQGEIAQGDLLGAEPSQERVDQDDASHDEVGATGIESRHRQALFEIEFHDLLSQATDLFRWEPADCGAHSE